MDFTDSPKDRSNKRCKALLIGLALLVLVVSVIVLAVLLALGTQDGNPPRVTDDEDEVPKSNTSSYRFGAVAADSELCSQIGTSIMAWGDVHAVDVAIATMICTGAVHPQSTGLGAGNLMTIYDKSTNEIITLIGREVAPLSATVDMYTYGNVSSTKGAMAIAVPGELASYAAAHERFGKAEWATLFEPTIKLCEEGIPVTPALADAIAGLDFDEFPTLREIFEKSDGSRYNAGDKMKRPVMARTLRKVATEGAETFYNGTLADDVVADIQDNGGIITKADLENYRPVWKQPVSVELSNGGYKLFGPPPPSSASVLQYILNILDGYNLTPDDAATVESKVLLTHRLVEAMKFGFGKRSHLGDEDFVNVTEWLELLRSDSYAESTRQKIRDDGVLPFEDYEPGFDIVQDAGTTHLSVMTPDGSAVGITSTNNFLFGSKVRGSRTGVIFNDEMDDFSTPGTVNGYGVPSSPSNYIEPGKRPMSSMSPTIVIDKDDKVVMVVGAAGGTKIISSILQVIMRTLWLGYELGDALDGSLVHHQLLPNNILHEPSLEPEIREGLKAKGHTFTEFTRIFCVIQAVQKNCSTTLPDLKDRCVQAASDARKGGAPDGY